MTGTYHQKFWNNQHFFWSDGGCSASENLEKGTGIGRVAKRKKESQRHVFTRSNPRYDSDRRKIAVQRMSSQIRRKKKELNRHYLVEIATGRGGESRDFWKRPRRIPVLGGAASMDSKKLVGIPEDFIQKKEPSTRCSCAKIHGAAGVSLSSLGGKFNFL